MDCLATTLTLWERNGPQPISRWYRPSQQSFSPHAISGQCDAQNNHSFPNLQYMKAMSFKRSRWLNSLGEPNINHELRLVLALIFLGYSGIVTDCIFNRKFREQLCVWSRSNIFKRNSFGLFPAFTSNQHDDKALRVRWVQMKNVSDFTG